MPILWEVAGGLHTFPPTSVRRGSPITSYPLLCQEKVLASNEQMIKWEGDEDIREQHGADIVRILSSWMLQRAIPEKFRMMSDFLRYQLVIIAEAEIKESYIRQWIWE